MQCSRSLKLSFSDLKMGRLTASFFIPLLQTTQKLFVVESQNAYLQKLFDKSVRYYTSRNKCMSLLHLEVITTPISPAIDRFTNKLFEQFERMTYPILRPFKEIISFNNPVNPKQTSKSHQQCL